MDEQSRQSLNCARTWMRAAYGLTILQVLLSAASVVAAICAIRS
jgi:hypothetical protein